MKINGITYRVIKVPDHLQNIVLAITEALDAYAHKEAVALDFSDLRKRGMPTSHSGVTSGAASFAISLDNMVQPFTAGREDMDKFPVPIAILSKDHADFAEFKGFTPKTILFHDGENLVSTPSSKGGKLTPYWELPRSELKRLTKLRKKRAEPW